MTSAGYLSPARTQAGLAILIFTAASVLPQTCAHAGSVFGKAQPSARIHALGGHFAGIIPDQLTDLTLNPAHAWGAESLTINYGFRHPYSQDTPFPVAGNQLNPIFNHIFTDRSNEIRLFGMSAWGWRWAIDTEWDFYHSDHCDQSGTNPIDRFNRTDYQIDIRENCSIGDNNLFRLDIASARKVGDRTVLGFRAGGTYRYHNSKTRSRRSSEYYHLDSDAGEYVPDRGYKDDDLNDASQKIYAGYLQAGMTWKDSGEIVVRGGYAEGTYVRDDYDLRIESRYDDYSFELDEYYYRLEEFREDRQGDTWKLSAFAKKKYSGGIVIVAAGAHEKGSYECGWRETYTLYSWGGYNETQIEDMIRYPGDGIRTRSEAIFRMGKTFALESRIDLTPGAHVNYSRERFEESGDAGIESFTIKDDVSSSFQSRFPLAFERSESLTELVLPLAIELRPASFFHLYSGFGVTFRWSRSIRKRTFVLPYGQLTDSLIPEEAETESNWFDTGFLASLGFSLRYGERLFVDMYTGQDIVPEYISKYYIDLRYVF